MYYKIDCKISNTKTLTQYSDTVESMNPLTFIEYKSKEKMTFSPAIQWVVTEIADLPDFLKPQPPAPPDKK
jgi:hypothetical protein